MKQIKFIILTPFLLLFSNQKSFSQDLTGFYFTCAQPDNKDSFVIDFRSHVFYLKETKYIRSRDTTITYEKAFQYSIDTSKCNEYVFTYNFKRSYESGFVPGIRTIYGQLQYHRKYKTLTFTYYKRNKDDKEIGRAYRYSIKKIEVSEKQTK